MIRSFLGSRAIQPHPPGQPGRFKSLLGHLTLRCLIATTFALTVFAPQAILAQTNDGDETQSDAEASADVDQLKREVFRLYQAGRTKEALLLAKRALAIREKLLGQDQPATAQILNNLGFLLHKMGDLKEAKPYLERELTIREKVLSPNHPDMAQSLGNNKEPLRPIDLRRRISPRPAVNVDKDGSNVRLALPPMRAKPELTLQLGHSANVVVPPSKTLLLDMADRTDDNDFSSLAALKPLDL